MFKNRIAVAAGSVAAAMLAQILSSKGIPVVSMPACGLSGRRIAPSFAGRIPKSAAPRLKKPRTSGDFEAITRAQLKRERRAAKLAYDWCTFRYTYYFTRDAAVAAEALAVYHAIEAVA
ncbi:hypothetical protein [Burkholderia seminalis]|uniref:hypothetical protein n=1 Tax=Burkholderia seminalis TaxID=488731 RepID=UPI000F59BA2C|nr:hypothetical protein [Burkholderia seminalis]RQS88046.1 hypothetical protein DF048_27370 [Burkholderia seminalis]